MALRLLVSVFLAAGCFDPNVKNGGFTCNPTDVPACPLGFFCFAGRCVDTVTIDASVRQDHLDLSIKHGDDDLALHHGASHDLAGPRQDLAGVVQDLAGVVVVKDLAMPHHDLAHPPPDLAPGPDMATGMCGHAGTPCTDNSQCCSFTCDPHQGNICIGG
jgi:hypothetical protein